jgi:SAM-dependent methyltransferase
MERLTPQLRQKARWRLARIRRPARLGSLRRTTPVSDDWGRDRGTPVDRYYIEAFLARHAQDIQGRVLEVMDAPYTERFGAGVTRSDVLDIDASNPQATIVADLAVGDGIPAEAFDCVILTQTLQYIFEVRAAVANVSRALKPGGVLLCTVPIVSRFSLRTRTNEFWRFTPAGCAELLAEEFPRESLTIEAPGNVLAGVAFLLGMAAEELSPSQLAESDPRFPLLVLGRAVKPRA